MEPLDLPLPEDTKEKLIQLVNIYTEELNFSNEGIIATDPLIYTVYDLKIMCGMPWNDHDE
jgi:cyanate lyase